MARVPSTAICFGLREKSTPAGSGAHRSSVSATMCWFPWRPDARSVRFLTTAVLKSSFRSACWSCHGRPWQKLFRNGSVSVFDTVVKLAETGEQAGFFLRGRQQWKKHRPRREAR